MKKLIQFATPLIAVAIMTSVPMMTLAQSSQQGNQTQNSSTSNWNTPPAGTEQAQQGYRDGIQAAKLDTVTNRKVDPKASYLYNHPPVKKGSARDEYLQNFVAGYQAAVQHGVATGSL